MKRALSDTAWLCFDCVTCQDIHDENERNRREYDEAEDERYGQK